MLGLGCFSIKIYLIKLGRGVHPNSVIKICFFLIFQNITITVDVTTNHQGWFIAKPCPSISPDEVVTQKCFDSHILPLAETKSDRYYIPKGTPKSAMLKYEVSLPKGVTCSQCVIQWTWTSGTLFLFTI